MAIDLGTFFFYPLVSSDVASWEILYKRMFKICYSGKMIEVNGESELSIAMFDYRRVPSGNLSQFAIDLFDV